MKLSRIPSIGAMLAFGVSAFGQNVGVGTAAPLSRVQILGTGSTLATSSVNVTNSGGTSMLFVRDDGNVGIGTTSPSAAALLDMTSTAKGLLIPRMTAAQVAVIATPATGLLVFITDFIPGFWYYNGIDWVRLITNDLNGGWLIDGNPNTLSASHFIGTTNSQDLVFKTNSNEHLRIKVGGLIEILNQGFGNTILGFETGITASIGTGNTFFGYQTGHSILGGANNVFAGTQAGYTNAGGSNNLFAGYGAGYGNTSASDNTFLGYRAGYVNSLGATNTFIGKEAGYNNTISDENVFVGAGSGYSNSTGASNTFIGTGAGFSSGGSYNVFTGNQAGYNSGGSANTGSGYQALYSNSAGNNGVALGYYSQRYVNDQFSSWDNTNTSVGYQSLRGSAIPANNTGVNNTVIGRDALFSNTTGSNNTANGARTLNSNTTGIYNTANGAYALYFNTIGHDNTANGTSALYSNTTGYDNTVNGAYALFSNSAGYANTANGVSALYSNTTGIYNTANGRYALYFNTTGYDNTANGATALRQNTTGFDNTATGFGALFDNTTGSENTALGYNADVSVNNLTNATAIGAHASVGASNSVVIGSISGLNGASSDANVGVNDDTPANTFIVGNGDKFQVNGTNGDVIFTDDQASITFPGSTGTPQPEIFMFASGISNSDRMILSHSPGFPTYGLQYADAGDEFHFLSAGVATMTVGLGAGVGILEPNPAYDLHLAFDNAAKPTTNTWTVPSDARLKTNVHDYSEGLASIERIHPVWFTYTGEAHMPHETGVGVLAQELKEVAPYMVGTWEYEDAEGNMTEYLDVNNGAMTYMLINAVKELSEQNKTLSEQNQALQAQATTQQAQINQLLESIGIEVKGK